MKRIAYSLLAFVVLLTGALYGVWFYLTGKLITGIEKTIEEQYQYADAEIDYNIEKYGFPTHAGVSLTKFNTRLKDTTGQRTLNLSLVGTSHYTMPILSLITNPGRVYVKGHNLSLLADVEDLTQAADLQAGMSRISQLKKTLRDEGFLLEIVDLSGDFKLFGNRSGTIHLSDVDFYVGSPDNNAERLVTIDDFSYETQGKSTKGLIDMATVLNLSGATFMNPDEKKSIVLKEMLADFSIKKAPLKEIMDARKAILSLGEEKNTTALKESLSTLVDTLQKNSSQFNINTLHVDVSDLVADASLTIQLDEHFRPEGTLNINLETEKEILNALPENKEENAAGSFAQQFLGGMANLNISVAADKGYLIINNVPSMTVPPLLSLIELMPDALPNAGIPQQMPMGDGTEGMMMEEERPHPAPHNTPFEPGSYVEPEHLTDDLLGHFKDSE